MPLDHNNIRVDILRIKRKLYISYPEGSMERKEFLLASKLSELKYLQTLVAPDLIDTVFDEYKSQQRAETANICVCVIGGICLSVMMLGFHQLHPANIWLKSFYVPAIAGIGYGLTHVYHFIQYHKSMIPFKLEYEKIGKKIEKLLKEIKDISK
jgi:hypothetical protein